MNKKMVVYALGIVALSGSMAYALTAPGGGVVGSIHDMNIYGGANQDTEGRVCAFCHTPHHAITDTDPNTDTTYLPLWSHNLPNTGGYSAYDSATIDATIDATTMMEGPSKLCMSCHDGAIAVDTHYATTGVKFLDSDGWNGAAIAKTNTLSNDHPIGFVYDSVAKGPVSGDPSTGNLASNPNEDNWIRSSDAAYKGNTAILIKDRLFSTPAGAIMTCATCHDVHNKKNKDLLTATTNYLLLSPNSGSQLCLTCHIK